MNYGEEYAYWYLRLNGFFPISNFVIHRSSKIRHSSDCDVLGVRPPYVYEEIGGQKSDWDTELTNAISFDKTVGVICEVKTGAYAKDDLFKKENMAYVIPRLGFAKPETTTDITNALENEIMIEINGAYRVFKLLIAEQGETTGQYLFKPLDAVIDFIYQRINKYPKEKFGDRMFFSSIQLQSAIHSATKKTRRVPRL